MVTAQQDAELTSGVAKLEAPQLLELARACDDEYIRRLDGSGAQKPSSIESTVDLALAGYYSRMGVPLIKVEQRGDGRSGGRHQDARFYFAMTKDVAHRLRIQWLNSDEHKYDAAIRSLKKVCSEMRYDRGSRRG